MGDTYDIGPCPECGKFIYFDDADNMPLRVHGSRDLDRVMEMLKSGLDKEYIRSRICTYCLRLSPCGCTEPEYTEGG